MKLSLRRTLVLKKSYELLAASHELLKMWMMIGSKLTARRSKLNSTS